MLPTIAPTTNDFIILPTALPAALGLDHERAAVAMEIPDNTAQMLSLAA
jgi:hypothetical protein